MNINLDSESFKASRLALQEKIKQQIYSSYKDDRIIDTRKLITSSHIWLRHITNQLKSGGNEVAFRNLESLRENVYANGMVAFSYMRMVMDRNAE